MSDGVPWKFLNGVISNTVVPQDKHFIQKIELSGTLPSHPHVPTSMSTQSALPTMTMNECELFISFLKSSSPHGHKSLFSFTFSPINKHHPSYFLLSSLRWMNKALCTASSSVKKEVISPILKQNGIKMPSWLNILCQLSPLFFWSLYSKAPQIVSILSSPNLSSYSLKFILTCFHTHLTNETDLVKA